MQDQKALSFQALLEVGLQKTQSKINTMSMHNLFTVFLDLSIGLKKQTQKSADFHLENRHFLNLNIQKFNYSFVYSASITSSSDED